MSSARPDPTLVAAAVAVAADWTGGDPAATWSVVDTVMLKNSTIHFIDLNGTSPRTRLVYKTKTSSSGREWFDENPTLTNVAVRLLEAGGLRGTPVLVVDPDRLIVVTLYVEGEALRPLGWSHGRLDEATRQTYVDIGRGAAILESVTGPVADRETEKRLWRNFTDRLGSASLDDHLKEGVEVAARASFENATSEAEPLFMGHSDLTFGNIIVGDGVPALIDISFSRSLRGRAVAKLLHRLEFTGQLTSPATTQAIEAVREGYGDEPAAMPFFRADRLVRMLDSPGGPLGLMSVRRRRALQAVRRMVDSAG